MRLYQGFNSRWRFLTLYQQVLTLLGRSINKFLHRGEFAAVQTEAAPIATVAVITADRSGQPGIAADNSPKETELKLKEHQVPSPSLANNL